MSKIKSRPANANPTRASSTWEKLVQPEDRNGLTPERIVAAGIALADQYGLAAVSIRKIAAQLGSSPMALYHYVPSKGDLLNLILNALDAEFKWPADKFTDWRSILTHFARESRRCLKRHPWASALRAADPEYGPACIRTLEVLLNTLSEFGLGMRTAARALGVLFVFVNGFVAAETSETGIRPVKGKRRAVHQPRFSRVVLATGNFPNVSRFVEMEAELPDDDGFERGLNWILDGIEADIKTEGQLQTVRRKKTAGR
ncbi:MAG TPA: TetR/AcrR family transcriptional regulator [Bryobacteraceae bacterium]|nr:TetR/AcrR family transcriptional regulator [Bryobacteraceae bacterium]